MKSYIADQSGGQPAASSTKGPASRQTFPSPMEGLRWTATVEGKHMSQNKIIAVVAALVILIAIIGWAVMRRGGEQATSQPPPAAPSQQQTPPQPQQP